MRYIVIPPPIAIVAPNGQPMQEHLADGSRAPMVMNFRRFCEMFVVDDERFRRGGVKGMKAAMDLLTLAAGEPGSVVNFSDADMETIKGALESPSAPVPMQLAVVYRQCIPLADAFLDAKDAKSLAESVAAQ